MTYSAINIHHKPFFGSQQRAQIPSYTGSNANTLQLQLEERPLSDIVSSLRDDYKSKEDLSLVGFEDLSPELLKKTKKDNLDQIAIRETSLKLDRDNLEKLPGIDVPTLRRWATNNSIPYANASSEVLLRRRLTSLYEKNITIHTTEIAEIRLANKTIANLLKKARRTERQVPTEDAVSISKQGSLHSPHIEFPFQSSQQEQHKWFQSHLANQGERLDRGSLETIYKGISPSKSSTLISDKTDAELLELIREIIDLEKEKPAISFHIPRSKSPSQSTAVSENPFAVTEASQRQDQTSPAAIAKSVSKTDNTANDLAELGLERARDLAARSTEKRIQALLTGKIAAALKELSELNPRISLLSQIHSLELPPTLSSAAQKEYIKGVLTAQKKELERMLEASNQPPIPPSEEEIDSWKTRGTSRASKFLEKHTPIPGDLLGTINQEFRITQRLKQVDEDIAMTNKATTTEQLLRLMVTGGANGPDWLYDLSAPGHSLKTGKTMLLTIFEREKALLSQALSSTSAQPRTSNNLAQVVPQPAASNFNHLLYQRRV